MFAGDAYQRDEVAPRYPAAREGTVPATLPRGTRLPLQALVETTAYGCTIRLPVRAEHVRVDKWPVVVEQVLVHKAQVDDTVRLDESVRREALRVDAEGDVRVTEQRTDAGGVLWER
jgi:hypothetical protein